MPFSLATHIVNWPDIASLWRKTQFRPKKFEEARQPMKNGFSRPKDGEKL